MIYRFLCLICVVLPSMGFGVDLIPWFPRYLEIQAEAHYLYQHYQHIDYGTRSYTHHTDDHFLNLSLSGSYDRWFAALQATFADTRRQNPGYDHSQLTGRYLWANDVIGDPLSLAVGLTVIQASKRALYDISSFHHGRIELEGHLAIGKELVCEQFWTARWWTLFALGAGDHGSPWIRLNAGVEKNQWDCSSIRFFVHTLWGLGNENLKRFEPFRGYGSIDHRSVDVGGRFTYNFNEWGDLSLEYTYRPFARNFPKDVHLYYLRWRLPFGL